MDVLLQWWRLEQWWLGWLIVMILGGSACKRHPAGLSVEESTAKLSSIVDNNYILMMAEVPPAPDANPETTSATAGGSDAVEQLYEFITCALEHNVDTSRGRWPNYPHTSGLARSADPTTPGRVVSYRMSTWGVHYDFAILPDSCVPTYQTADGVSLHLRQQEVKTRVAPAINRLKVERDRTDIAQGTHYLAAFGYGAMFKGFAKSIRQAIMTLLPQSMSLKPFVAFMAQVGLTVPFGASGSYLFDKLESENHVVVMPHHLKEQIDERAHEMSVEHWSGAGVSGAAGFFATQVVINQGAKAGPIGALVGYVIVPFVVTVLVNTRANHAKEVLDNFRQIFAIHDPNTIQTPSAQAQSTSIIEVSRILGEAMLLAGWWGDSIAKPNYCVPASPHGEGGESECSPLQPAY